MSAKHGIDRSRPQYSRPVPGIRKRKRKRRARRERLDDALFSAGLVQVRSKRGMASAIAKHLGVTKQAVAKWRQVPLARLAQVSRISGIPEYLFRTKQRQSQPQSQPPRSRSSNGKSKPRQAKSTSS
jgi:hypothetical protein